MARKPSRTTAFWQVHGWKDRATIEMSAYTTRGGAIQGSYRAFACGDAYPDVLITPDDARIPIDDEHAGEGDSDLRLTDLWDEWLAQHPEERADWDTGPRAARLRTLEERHAPNPRPFSSAAIVANPDWYRRIYGILGMTDEQFDAYLHLHRFALAEEEAQRRAKQRATTATAPKATTRTTAAIYLQEPFEDPAQSVRAAVPLKTQERACRAYCKRMGYKVHPRVFRAQTPPPENVPLTREIGIGPEHAFVYYQRRSAHPYHVVDNLLAQRTIDVIVKFVASGPSRPLYETDSTDAPGTRCPVEWASLWEIEPPTEDERRLDELVTLLGQSEREEEQAPLLEELAQVSKRVKALQAPTLSSSETEPVDVAPAIVTSAGSRQCYACRTQPARAGSAFCSDACAQSVAERHVQMASRGWCSECGVWVGEHGCPHMG